jgi:RND family efflux transporter MFP subunit
MRPQRPAATQTDRNEPAARPGADKADDQAQRPDTTPQADAAASPGRPQRAAEQTASQADDAVPQPARPRAPADAPTPEAEQAGAAADAGQQMTPTALAETTPAEEAANVNTFYGTAAPFEEANVQSEQGGTIVALNGKEGDAVRKGDVIVRFNDSDIRLQLEQAKSSRNAAAQQVQQAESNLKTVETNYQRYQKLLDDGFVSKQQVDDLQNQLESARSALNSAKESVTQAEANVKLIENNLQDFSIRAPISGVIDAKNYNLQEVYRSGDIIYHLVNIDRIYVNVEVPETYISQIREQMPVTVAFDALEGREFEGLIETISPSGGEDNRSFTVKVLLDNPDRAIKPGMFGRVNVILGEASNRA